MYYALSWALLGGAIGFYYGWRQMAAGHARSRAIIDSVSATSREQRLERARMIGRINAYRSVAAFVSGFVGSIVGLVIWAVAAIAIWAMGATYP